MSNFQYIKSVSFVVLLIVFLFLIEATIKLGIKNSDSESIGKINLILNHKVDPDLIIFGSSIAQVHFDPKIIEDEVNLTAFNAGLSGTPFQQNHGLIMEFADYSTNCKYVVLAESYFSLERRTSINKPSNFVVYLNNKYIQESLKQIDSSLIWKCKYVPFYDLVVYNQEFYNSTFKGLKNLVNKSEINLSDNGFEPTTANWENEVDLVNNKTKAIFTEINSEVIKKYRDVVKYLNDRGKKVILVIPPIHIQGQSKIRNLEEVRTTFRDIAGSNNYLLDYTLTDINHHREFFKNNTHLNNKGAREFSLDFAEDLKKIISLNNAGED